MSTLTRVRSGEQAPPPPGVEVEAQVRRNIFLECSFNLLNGIFVGMIFYAAPVVVKTSLAGKGWHIALILCAFPAGAFLAPLWASLGRRWGMQGMVLRLAVVGNLPLFLVPLLTRQSLLEPATAFSILVTVSLLIYSAMKMGQSSLYRSNYPASVRGRVLGWLLLCNYMTMVPTTFFAGWIIAHPNDPTNYRWLYPVTAVLGLAACLFYRRLKPLAEPEPGPAVSFLESLRQVRRVLTTDRDFGWFQLGFFLNGSAFFMAIGVVLEQCKEGLGLDPRALALIMASLPLVMLAVCSPFWGWVLDRIGIVWLRVLVAVMMTIYLTCYFLGILFGQLWLIYLASFLRGISESGGQVTWQLASVQFAPTDADVPVYNSIHFTLNGVRGLLMPWLGLQLLGLMGPWTLVVPMAVSAASIFVGMNLVRRREVPVQPQTLDLPPEV